MDEGVPEEPQTARKPEKGAKAKGVCSQERLFKAKRRPLQPTQAFSVQRMEMEKMLDRGFTFQELAAEYKMDEGVRRHSESLAAQIKETGNFIRLRGKPSEAERRQATGATHQALTRRGLNSDLSARAETRGGVHYVLEKVLGKPSPVRERQGVDRKSERIKALLGASPERLRVPAKGEGEQPYKSFGSPSPRKTVCIVEPPRPSTSLKTMLHRQLIMPSAQSVSARQSILRPALKSEGPPGGELALQLSQILPVAQTAYHQAIDESVEIKSYHSRSQTALHYSEDPVPNFAKPTTAAMVQRTKKNSVRVMTTGTLDYGLVNSTMSQSTSHRCLPCRRQSVA